MNRSFSLLLAGLLCLGPAFYTQFCSEEFKVQSSRFKVERMGRASVTAKVGCVPRTINICQFS